MRLPKRLHLLPTAAVHLLPRITAHGLVVPLALGILLAGLFSATPGVAQVPDHLKCYKVKDPLRLAAAADLDAPQFGLDPGCVISKATLFCVPVTKTNVSAKDRTSRIPIAPLPVSAAAAEGDRICYKVKCPTPGPASVTATDQFGSRTLIETRLGVGLKADLVCTPAVKGTAYCGDGVIGSGEQCEGNDLGGATCQSLGFATGTLACAPDCAFDISDCAMQRFSATGQTVTYTTGDDGDLRAGAALSYIDNGNGTITDLNTGLIWEKKSDDGGLHDKDRAYTWTPGPGSIWEWIAELNAEGGSGFAGHSDWRIPNIKELYTLTDYGTPYHINAIFVDRTNCTPGCSVLTCSCNQTSRFYWSSTSESLTAAVVFADGGVLSVIKTTNDIFVRAVRGGL